VDYKVVVTNAKDAGSAYRAFLTDTLYDPKGASMYDRSWDLETIVPGDQITLTYTVEYATSTMPGTYHNVARVTGKSNSSLSSAVNMTPVAASRDVNIVSNGLVLGAATSTPQFAELSIAVAPTSCVPLLTNFMKQGPSNDVVQVKKLQTFLNETQRARLPVTGYFGPMTTTAVKNFQLKYKSEILAPLGLLRATGNVYGSTQRKINQLNCGVLPLQSARESVDTSSESTIESLLAQLASLQAVLASLQQDQRGQEDEDVVATRSQPVETKPQPVAISQAPQNPFAKAKEPESAATQEKKKSLFLTSFGGIFSNLFPKK